MNRVHYAFETFKDLKSFDILPHEELIERFQEVEDSCYLLAEGKNVESRSDIPLRFRFQPKGRTISAVIKSDVNTMDMDGLGEKFYDWVYLTIPFEFVNKFQTRTLENQITSVFRRFMAECIEKDLDTGNLYLLQDEYDKKYPDLYKSLDFTPYFPFWRYLLFVDQFETIWREGLVYPICYNDTHDIFRRGTHRSLMIAATGHDVPILLQRPCNIEGEWRVRVSQAFNENELTAVPDLENKVLKFYDKDNNEIYSSSSPRT